MAVRQATRLVQRALGRWRDRRRTGRSRVRTGPAMRADTRQRTGGRGGTSGRRRGGDDPVARRAMTVATTSTRPRGMRVGRADSAAPSGAPRGTARRGARAGRLGLAGPRWAAFALSVAIVVWSLVANWGLGDAGYTARNLLLTAAALLAGRMAGLQPADVGLSREAVGAGLRWGGGAAALIAAVIGAGVALDDVLPGVAALLADERAQLDGATLAAAVLVRMNGRDDVQALHSAGQDFAAAVRYAAGLARSSGTPCRVALLEQGRAFRVESARQVDAAEFAPVAGRAGRRRRFSDGVCIGRVKRREHPLAELPKALEFCVGEGFSGTVEIRGGNSLAAVRVIGQTGQVDVLP